MTTPSSITGVFTDVGSVVTGSLDLLGTLVANPLIAIPILIGVAGIVITLIRKLVPGVKASRAKRAAKRKK